MRDYPPIHPGEILREEFLIPMGISQYRLAKELAFPPCALARLFAKNGGLARTPRFD